MNIFKKQRVSWPLGLITALLAVCLTPDGTKTVFASGLNGPVGITVSKSGTVFVAMCNANNVTRIGSDGAASIFATDPGFRCPSRRFLKPGRPACSGSISRGPSRSREW